MSKIAFVTPWYGAAIVGGAEMLARRTVEQLHHAGVDVEVLTTGIKDFFADWGRNCYQPGIYQVNGVTVRRFPVQKRDQKAFDEINWRLIQGLPITVEQERTFIHEMIRVPALYDYIAQHTREYLFVFIPYMFATTYFGAQICPERSVVIPCLHDEGYAYMNIFREVLPRVRALAFNTVSESNLAARLLGKTDAQIRSVVGIGVDTDFTFDPTRFRQKYGVAGTFMLYVGRREAGKNTPLLLDFWGRYTRETRTDAKLVLIGPGQVQIPPELAAHVIDLGFVPIQDKYDAYAAADLLCQPSVNESFSLVIMESWLTETPVLVHGDCTVTRDHCRLSNGGLYFTNYAEFAATLDYLFANPAVARQMGQNGRAYVLANFQWPMVLERYAQIISSIEDDEDEK